MNLRPATPADAREIAEVHVRTWQAAYAHIFPAEFLAELSVERRAQTWAWHATQTPEDLVVAEDAGKIVGFVSVGATEGEKRVGELYAIYVDPSYWGSGAGPALMEAAVVRLRAAGFEEAILWVLADNPRARAFYERHGWRVDGERREEIGGVDVLEVRYRLSGLSRG